MRKLVWIAALTALVGCDNEPTLPGEPFVVSGTTQNNTGVSIPANARVLVLWTVNTGSPDYGYVFGEGTVNADGSFQITFPSDPPAAAINSYGLGVGLVVLTTDQTLSQGKVPSNYSFNGILGATEDHSVIFRGNLDAAVTGWPLSFPARYAVGLVQRNTTGFDSFVVAASSSLVLVVDDLENINPPNWT